jgi:S-adenosylmethionine synthetase
LEACCGKNPVYHVGKLYTAIGSRVAQEIYDRLGLETCVFLTSQMGRPLSDPWFVRIEVAEISVNQEQRRQILDILDHYLAQPQETTMKIVEGSLRLY